MAGFREFLQTRGGIIVGAVLVLVVVIVIYTTFRSDPVVSESNARWFVDTTDNKPFKHSVAAGESYPISAPSGQKSGYLAELCYWTADGHPKEEPTPVLLNEAIGKTGPTFCPDCHRLVVGHNPAAIEGKTPPPNEEEYKKRRPSPAAAPQGAREER